MSRIAILGSGFGLYGYLPALVGGCGRRVLLPLRYQERFHQRPELARFATEVDWADDEQTALQEAAGVVLALCPEMQSQWLSTCLELRHLECLFLEKPLATDPRTAWELHHKLRQAGKRVRVSYLFRYLDWAESLRRHVSSPATDGHVTVTWSFQAHHFRHDLTTWKRYHEQGGGVIRFYGIHLIALLAELGYTEVIHSSSGGIASNQPALWQAEFRGNGLTSCTVELDSCSAVNEFNIHAECPCGVTTLFERDDPFATARTVLPDCLDRRVDVIRRYCQSAWDDANSLPNFYQNTIDLWQQVETVNGFQVTRAAA